METEDKKTRKSKAFAISSLMRNPKLAKVIQDSFNSKVGSTRNAKAKSVLKSVYKADNNYNYFINDGKGGPGPNPMTNPFQTMLDPLGQHSGAFVSQQSQDPYQPSVQTQRPQTEVVTGVDNIPGFKGFAEAVAPIDYSKPISRAEEITRGIAGIPRVVGEQVKKAEEFAIKDILWPIVKYKFEGPTVPTGIGAYFTSPERPPIGWEKVGVEPKAEISYHLKGYKEPSKRYFKFSDKEEVYDKETGVHITGEEAAKISDFWDKVEVGGEISVPEKDYYRYSDSPKVFRRSDDTEVSYEEAVEKNIWDRIDIMDRPTEEVEPIDRTITDELAGDPDFGTTGNIANMTSEEFEAFIKQIGDDNSLNDYLAPSIGTSDLIKNIQAGYDVGLGAETTVAMLWKDKAKLAEMLGMSEEAAKLLPEYMLSSQLIDLRNVRYDEFRIDEQRNKIFDKQARGLTIEDDLRGYVRGKDEYLGQVDKLLFDTRKSVSEMDTSNPYVAERMGNYVNYLTILKGRQNQRYIDFLDMSIRDHRADIDQSINMYNRDLETVNKLISDEAALTTEAHTNIKDMLTEMYDNIEAREDRQWTLDAREIQRTEAQNKIITDGLNQRLLNLKISGYGVETDPVSPSTFDKFKTFFGSEAEDGTFVFDTHDPFEVMETANVTQQNAASVLTAFYQSMGRNVYSNASTGNVSRSDLNKFKNTISSRGGVFMDIDGNPVSVNNITAEQYETMTDEQKVEYEIKNNNSQMKDKLEINLRKGIEEYLTSSEEKIKEVRNAINDLSQIEGNWPYAWGKWDKNKFVKKNEGLGELSGFLYDYATKTTNLASEIEGKKTSILEVKELYDQFSDEDLPYYLSSDLAGYLMY